MYNVHPNVQLIYDSSTEQFIQIQSKLQIQIQILIQIQIQIQQVLNIY